MKRSELRRGTSRLKRTPMKPREKPIKAVSDKRRRENRQRSAMIDRLWPGRVVLCAVNAPGCTQFADDIHEPLTRGRGGSITDPDNAVPVCRSCHHVLTFTPESELGWAYERGLLRHSEPVARPWEAAS